MTIVNALPGIVPSARPYTMGEWPQVKMKMRNGRTVRWAKASMSTNEQMELSWENITYAQAESLVRTWDANYGIYGTLTLPPELFAGAELPLYLAALSGEIITTLDGVPFVAAGTNSGGMGDLMAKPFPGTTWRFTGPPQVTAVKAGRCTVRMRISARARIEQQP